MLANSPKRMVGFYETLIENIHFHLAYLDKNFNFIIVNSAYAKGSGHTKEELIGHNHFDWFSNQENRELFERARDTGRQIEYRAKSFEYADQPWRGVTYWNWALTPIKDDSGVVSGFVLTADDVTEQEKSKSRLEEEINQRQIDQSRIKYLASYPEQNPNPVMDLDLSGNIRYINRTANILFPELSSQGLKHPWLAYWNDIVNHFIHGTDDTFIRDVMLDEYHYYQQVFYYSASGHFIRIYGFDITKRKHLEKILQKNNERLAILADSANVLLSNAKPDSMIQTIADRVMRHLQCDVFFNYIVDESKGRLRLNAYAGVSAGFAGKIEWLDYGVAICGCVARDGCRIISGNIPENGDPGADLVRSLGIKAYACQPLCLGEKIVGTLSFGTRSRNGFTVDELELIKTVADQVSIAKQRMQMEDTIRASEENYRRMIETANEGIVICNSDDSISFVNQRRAEMLGHTSEELVGRKSSEFLERDQEDNPIETGVGRKGDLKILREVNFRRKDGSSLWTVASVSLLADSQGESMGSLIMYTDITDYKRVNEEREQLLRRIQEAFSNAEHNRAQLEAIFTAQKDVILLYDTGMNVLRANPSFLANYGFNPVGFNVKDIIRRVSCRWLDGRPFLLEEQPTLRALRGEKVTSAFFTVKKCDGSEAIVETSSGPTWEGKDITGSVTVWHDITERKQAEELLERAKNQAINDKNRFQAVMEALPVGVAITDECGGNVQSNYTFGQIWGGECPRVEVISDYAAYKAWWVDSGQTVQPEEWASARAVWNGETVIGQQMKIRRFDGTYRFILNSAAPIYDVRGEIAGSAMAIQDITPLKQFEEILQSKQDELAVANEELQAQQEEVIVINEELHTQQEKLNITYQELQSQAEANWRYAETTAQALYEAKQRAVELDATIASIAAGVLIVDHLGNVIRINEFARNLLGYAGEDLKLPFQERVAKLNLIKTDGLPYPINELPLYRALQGEIIRDEEMKIQKLFDKLVWISATCAPIHGDQGNLMGAILIFTNITKQKRKTENLLASERELLQVTLNSIGEGVVATDPEEQIIFINYAATNITGYSRDQAIGQPLTKILYIFDDKTSEPTNKIPSGKEFNHLVLVTRDLKEVAISLSSAPIKTADGQIIGKVIVFQDITEKQKTERELLKAAKLDSLGILAGGVAHDFNNILAGILANLQLAGVKLRKHQDISQHIKGSIEITRKASNLTKQLLTFAKGGDPVKKAASIAKLVKDTVQFALSGSKVKAVFNLPEDLWTVDIDEGQISQVINNLTINAAIGGTLEITAENVALVTGDQYNPGQYVKLAIKDHGIGIPTEIMNKIFDPFFTTKKTGNGLGLSTSYSIIKKLQGYLEAESTPGIGTTFCIMLPVSLSEVALIESQEKIAISGGAKILLMDDEDTIRNVGGEMLICYGYRVTLARDGQETIELYKKAMEMGEPFDTVIMDLTMPGGLGGIETMTILRRIDPKVKAIISSGYANDPVMSDYERYGFSGVVTKPYKFDEFNEILNKVIERKQLPLDFTY